MSEQVQMPGDGDEAADKLKAERKSASEEMRSAAAKKAAAKKEEPKKKADGPSAKDAAEGRGEVTPAQVEGDGWGDIPAQMRG